jgi:hypothetical protein
MPGRPNTPNRSASLKETILRRQLPLMASTWIACARYTPVVPALVGGEPGRAVGGDAGSSSGSARSTVSHGHSRTPCLAGQAPQQPGSHRFPS